MHYFYAPDIDSGNYTLDQVQSRHAVRSLRLKEDDNVVLLDGKGGVYACIIIDVKADNCILKIESKEQIPESKFKIHIAIAPTKSMKRFEWFLEKATEIGVHEITPLKCERSERDTINMNRQEMILITAIKQSGQAYVPIIHPIANLFQFIAHDCDQKFIAYLGGDATAHLSTVYQKEQDVHIVIGPEGDFTDTEVKIALDSGYKAISLGPNRLRTETAGVVACSIINSLNI